MALSSEQRAGLQRSKLRSLARDAFGWDDGVDHDTPWGAALEHDGAWIALLEVAPARSFGQALVLAARHDARSLDLFAASDSATVARQAALFDPSPTVWRIDGSDLHPAVAAAPVMPPSAAPIEPRIAQLLDVAQVDVVIEHGVIVAECRGLEVARVTGAGSEQRLDVGVGAYDQGAFAVMNPDLTPDEALANVVTQVLDYRRSGGDPHPLNRLARERWIRSELLDDASSIGLTSLDAVEPMTPREGVKESAPASALGISTTGERVLVACSVGIDLDAVPTAAYLAELHQADRILLVLPDRDRHPLVQAVAAQSRRPVAFATSPEPWTA